MEIQRIRNKEKELTNTVDLIQLAKHLVIDDMIQIPQSVTISHLQKG